MDVDKPPQRTTGETRDHGDFVASFAKGLAVVRSFTGETGPLTLTEVANRAGMTKPSARRLLLTLRSLDYVEFRDGGFRLRPRILELGYAYLSSVELPAIVDPIISELNSTLKEACSVGILENDSIIYIARAQTQFPIMSFSVRVGSRVDPVATSIGQVILAGLPKDELEALLDRREQQLQVPPGGWDRQSFLDRLVTVSDQGWAMLDQMVETGVRTLAAPIRNPRGDVVAGINVATHVSRVSLDRLMNRFLPALLEARDDIDREIASRGTLVHLS